MKVTDLEFSYPENLVATEPQYPSRVLKVDLAHGGQPQEITLQQLLEQIPAGDLFIVNNTKVLKRRIFAGELEILFLSQKNDRSWEVLFPSRKYAIGESIPLPGGVTMKLTQKGRPQTVELSETVDESYFQKWGELPLPPYIQKARAQRHTVSEDETWYQTKWAQKPGSFAAPTASLHFHEQEINFLKHRGVKVLEVTLHVGLGTFLPVTAEDLDQHDMHEEYAEIPAVVWDTLIRARMDGRKVWALGTTATRALESAAGGLLTRDVGGNLKGFTKILIQPPYQFQVVDRLLTNFHQPQSTLLALVSAFAGLEKVKACYQWAIARNFRLFSYGDLSVWLK
ncbi:tRNA preQ1(34) S-adenosylmethionine ribosyltransferase-isomerase QueA [Bdellovibrio sp. HCB337]|uniref:tRNA preQ1(34) S-adenosylmethionine ribosyltransferase-isomerase QueA n=1 Tax=Bdellovibrio sp. HCB337 TaxID=3394358 RepID=UPI0039A566FC